LRRSTRTLARHRRTQPLPTSTRRSAVVSRCYPGRLLYFFLQATEDGSAGARAIASVDRSSGAVAHRQPCARSVANVAVDRHAERPRQGLAVRYVGSADASLRCRRGSDTGRPTEIWDAIIDLKGQSGSGNDQHRTEAAAKLPHRPLASGNRPRLCSIHIAQRIVVAQEADEVCVDNELLREAIDLYVRPHLSTLGREQVEGRRGPSRNQRSRPRSAHLST